MAIITDTQPYRAWIWVLCGLLGVAMVALVYQRRFASLTTSNAEHLRAQRSNPENKASGLDCFVVPPRNDETDHTANELMTRIIQLMETQRLYLNPELKVGDVADALGVHRNAVSACVNAKGCTFGQFVNDYRVRHAKQLLSQVPDVKISTVGSESGFANESTFFRVFKTATGMTPKEWAAQQQDIS